MKIDASELQVALKRPKVSGSPSQRGQELTGGAWWLESMKDTGAMVPRAAEGIAHGVYNLADYVGFDVLPNWDEQRIFGHAKTLPGQLGTGILQFLVPFGGAVKGMTYAGKAAQAGRAAGVVGKTAKALTTKVGGKVKPKFTGYLAAGATADFLAWDGNTQRLSNLIQQYPELENPVTEFLAAKDDDDELVGRAKNVIEGLFLGLGIEALTRPFFGALRAIRNKGKATAEGVEEDEAIRVAMAGWDEDVKAIRASVEGTGATKDLPILPVGEARKQLKKAEDELGELLEGPDWQGDIGGGVSPKAVELQERVAAAEARVQEAKADRVRQAEPQNADEIIARIDELDDGVDVNVSFAGEDKLILQDILDARPPRQPYKTNLEAKRGLEGSRGPDYLKRRLLKKFPIKGADEADAKDVTEFIETIGGRMFDDVSLSVVSNFSAAGRFDFASKLVTIRKQTIEAGNLSRTAIHELWHAASRYLPGADVKRLTSQFTKARKKFMADLSKKAKNEKLTHKQRLEAAKELSGFKKGDYTTANYRFSELDEFFTEEMTDAFFRNLDAKDALAAPGTIKRVAQEIAILLKDMFASMKSKLGIDQRQKIFNDFLKQRNVKKQRSGPLDWRSGKTTADMTPVQHRQKMDDLLKDTEMINLPTGGGQAVRMSAAAKMTHTLPNGQKIEVSTAGYTHGQEGDIIDAVSDHLIQTGQAPVPMSKGKLDEAALEVHAHAMADATGMPRDHVDGLLKESAGDFSALQNVVARSHALRQTMVGKAYELTRAVDAWHSLKQQGQTDDVLDASIKNLMDQQLSLMARVSQISSGFGKALRSTQYDAGVIGLSKSELADVNLRQQYLNKRGGMTVEDIVDGIMMARAGQGSDVFAQMIGMNKIIRNASGGKWMSMVREVYINSLLWGPRTWSVNFVGNTIAEQITQFERYVGSYLTSNPALRRGVKHAWGMSVMSKEMWRYFMKAFKTNGSVLDSRTGSMLGDAGNERAIGAVSGENISQALEETFKKGDLLNNPAGDAFKTAIDFLAPKFRTPGRVLLGTDDLFKAFSYRARAQAQLWHLAEQRGLTDPDEIAEYVAEYLDVMTTSSGKHFSESSLTKDAIEAAVAAEKTTPFNTVADREKFIYDHVEKARNQTLDAARKPFQSSTGRQFDGLIVPGANNLEATAQLSKEWIDPSLEAAHKTTFTNEVGGAMGKIIEGVQAVPLSWLILPFVKVPTNLLKFSFSRLAAPFAGVAEAGIQKVAPGLYEGMQGRALEHGKQLFLDQLQSPDALVRAEANGRLATGVITTLALGTTVGMNKDRITGGGPVDHRQKRVWEAAGYRPYSIKFGDTWYSYQRLDPLATLIGVFADVAHTQDDAMHTYDKTEIEKLWAGVGITLARNVTNKSYLAGIQKFIEVMDDPDKKFTAAAQQLVANFIPNVAYHGQSLSGDQELKEVRSLADAIFKKLPGLSDRVDARRNLLGEPLEAEMVETTPFQIANPFNPIGFSSKTADPVLNELAKLRHGFTPPNHKLNGLVDLTSYVGSDGRTAYDRWQDLRSKVKVRGKTLRQSLASLFRSRKYQRLDPRSDSGLTSPRVKLIQRVLGDYRDSSLNSLFKEFPEIRDAYQRSSTATKSYRGGGITLDKTLAIFQQ